MKATPLQRFRDRVRTAPKGEGLAAVHAADDAKLLEVIDAMRALRAHTAAMPQGEQAAYRGKQWKAENIKLQRRVLHSLDVLEGKAR